MVGCFGLIGNLCAGYTTGPCPQLVFDQSVKSQQPMSGWEERGGTSRLMQARREEGAWGDLPCFRERQKGCRSLGEKANQPCDISGKWPLAASLIRPRVAGRGENCSTTELDSI